VPIREANDRKISRAKFNITKTSDVDVDLQVGANSPPGKYPIAESSAFKTCDESSCDRPQAASFEGTLTVGEANAVAGPLMFKEGELFGSGEVGRIRRRRVAAASTAAFRSGLNRRQAINAPSNDAA